ncbi:thioesterase family protein [Pannonibacter sp. Pt2-lr]
MPGDLPSLSDYPLHSEDKLRYRDTDRQGHVNNAVFATFLETGRVEVLYGAGKLQQSLADDGAAFVIARLELDFLAEVTWPGTVVTGTRVKAVGRSSITLEQAVFQNGACVARPCPWWCRWMKPPVNPVPCRPKPPAASLR